MNGHNVIRDFWESWAHISLRVVGTVREKGIEYLLIPQVWTYSYWHHPVYLGNKLYSYYTTEKQTLQYIYAINLPICKIFMFFLTPLHSHSAILVRVFPDVQSRMQIVEINVSAIRDKYLHCTLEKHANICISLLAN